MVMGGLTGNTIVLTMAKVPANGYAHIIGVAEYPARPYAALRVTEQG